MTKESAIQFLLHIADEVQAELDFDHRIWTNQKRLDALSMAISALSAQSGNCKSCNNQWISVETKLPEDMGNVLVCALWHERWQVMEGWCRKEKKEWFVYTSHGEVQAIGVTHWMPKPKVPEKGGAHE